jgi:hypothetical protein
MLALTTVTAVAESTITHPAANSFPAWREIMSNDEKDNKGLIFSNFRN